MGVFHDRMDQDMQIRGYAPRTRQIYLSRVKDFVAFFGTPPDKLGLEHIREYQLHLIDRKVSWSTFNQSVCALRFFFNITLSRAWDVRHLPFQKGSRQLPIVLSSGEVADLITAAVNLRDRAILMTLYGGGLRLNELRRLCVSDIDSKRMVIRIFEGKGRKDRYVRLPDDLLPTLRAYWLECRPVTILFPGAKPGKPLSARAIQRMVPETAVRAGISKRVTPHLLRHAFATHHAEQGTNLEQLRLLLGHRWLKTTSLYLHVALDAIATAPSPLDRLPKPRKEDPKG